MEQRFSDLIIRLANGISQRRMYFDAHPRVVSTSREVAADITELLRETGTDSLSFGVFGGKFVRNGRYLVGPSIAGRALIDFAERLGCGGNRRERAHRSSRRTNNERPRPAAGRARARGRHTDSRGG